jgi:hypothetical protein
VTELLHEPSSVEFSNAHEIKARLVAALPFAFPTSDAEEASKFRERYVSVSEFAAKAAKSPLSSETGRYQSLLIYLSLLFGGIRFFGASNVPPFSKHLVQSTSFMIAISVLIVAVAGIFITKVFVEYTTTAMGLSKDMFNTQDFNEYATKVIITTRIDKYYWLTIFNAIGDKDTAYSGNRRQPMFTLPSIKPEQIDVGELAKDPELAVLIKSREEFLKQVLAALDNASRITIQEWMDARVDLSSESLHLIPHLAKTMQIYRVLDRMHVITRITMILEIILPLVFASVVLAACWFSELRSANPATTTDVQPVFQNQVS